MLTTDNRLLSSGNRLPESKNLGKRFSLENSLEQNCAIQSFLLKKIFLYLS